jgi:hypothetical protein
MFAITSSTRWSVGAVEPIHGQDADAAEAGATPDEENTLAETVASASARAKVREPRRLDTL